MLWTLAIELYHQYFSLISKFKIVIYATKRICLVHIEDSILEIPLRFLGGIGANDLPLKTFFCSLRLNGNSILRVAGTKNVTLNP